MRAKLLVAASAAALGFFAFTPAMAAPAPAGYVDGGYSYTNANGGGGHIDDWNVKGAANIPLGASAFSVQIEGSYDGLSGSGASAHTDQGEVSLIWNHANGRIGATAGTNEIGGGSGLSSHFQNYGGFGVLYPNAQWTLGVKGASLTCSGCGSLSAWGGEVMGYPTPNVALAATVDDLSSSGQSLTTWHAGAEWQPTTQPWSVRFGYDNAKIPSGGPTLNTYSIGFRWYFGGNGTLVQHHRDGAETWGTRQAFLGLAF